MTSVMRRSVDTTVSSVSDSESMVQVRFRLMPDAQARTSVESEGLWASELSDGTFRLANVPWFVTGVAFDDILEAEPGADGRLWVTRVRQWSGRHVVRVSPNMQGDPDAVVEHVGTEFTNLGVEVEGMGPPRWMLALDIPAEADLGAIKGLLRAGAEAGRWTFEEACVGARWDDL
jgi:hypothetical protein